MSTRINQQILKIEKKYLNYCLENVELTRICKNITQSTTKYAQMHILLLN